MLVGSLSAGHLCPQQILHGTKNNHAWFKLNFNVYLEHIVDLVLSLRDQYVKLYSSHIVLGALR